MSAKIFLTTITVIAMYLGLSDGHLAIYSDGSAEAVQILPYATSMFTESDQCLLAEGIPFTSAEDLSKLLEDYTS